MLLSSNIFIYSVLPEYTVLCEWCKGQDIRASSITRLEVLGHHRLGKEGINSFQRLFEVRNLSHFIFYH